MAKNKPTKPSDESPDDLVQLGVNVKRRTKDAIEELSKAEGRTISQQARLILEFATETK